MSFHISPKTFDFFIPFTTESPISFIIHSFLPPPRATLAFRRTFPRSQMRKVAQQNGVVAGGRLVPRVRLESLQVYVFRPRRVPLTLEHEISVVTERRRVGLAPPLPSTGPAGERGREKRAILTILDLPPTPALVPPAPVLIAVSPAVHIISLHAARPPIRRLSRVMATHFLKEAGVIDQIVTWRRTGRENRESREHRENREIREYGENRENKEKHMNGKR